MPKLAFLVFSLLLPLTAFSQQADPGFEAAQKMRHAMMKAASGDVRGAWDVLYPEALKGDLDAMYALGQIMLNSGGSDSNRQQGVKLLQVAAERGHPHADVLLKSIQNGVSVEVQSIASRYGITVDAVKQRMKQAQSEIMRLLPDDLEQRQVLVKVFIDTTSGYLEQIYPVLKNLSEQFGSLLGFKLYMVIDPDNSNPVDMFAAGTSNLPRLPFFPDAHGQELKRFGVFAPPAVVVSVMGNDITLGQVSADELRSKLIAIVKDLR